jgi:hypothetical protein
MVDQTLQVSGGIGGVTAHYEDMLTYAQALDRLAREVADRLGAVQTVAVNGDLLASAPLSPVTAGRVTAQVLASTTGPHGMAVTAARLQAASLSLRVAVTAYRSLDEAQEQLVWLAEAAAAPPALLLTAGAELPRAVWDIRTGDLEHLLTIPGLTAQNVLDLLYANPWLVDGVIRDAPLLMGGLAGVVGLAGTALLSSWTMGTEGSPFPPANLAQSSADLIAIAGMFGLLRDGTGRAKPAGPPGAPNPRAAPLPDSISGLFDGIGSLGREPGTARVFAVTGDDGVRRWVVQLPGTQEWSPAAGENPVDLTNNLRLMAGQQTAQNDAIRDAMRQAGIARGEPVLLAGHSQGGITAASLAADTATRAEFTITHVVTGGSPIAGFDIPPDVTVLAVEHEQDAVPRLDGADNPDRPTWATVVRDPTGLVTRNGGPVDTTMESHDTAAYADTGHLIDASSDPSLAAVRTTIAPFLIREPAAATVQVFHMTRSPG